MNSFEKINFEKPEDRVIRNIFPTEGRKGFIKKIQEVLKWSKNGGPKIGTPLFIRGVIGRINLKPEEFLILKREINREIRKIEKSRENNSSQKIRMKPKENQFKNLSSKAEEDLIKELERSGGIDPNEI